MSDGATITREQLRTVVIATELGGDSGDSNHFSYAKLGSSAYSFGQLQFDVGRKAPEVIKFLQENGFDATDVERLSKHGGLSNKELDALDAKLQAIPQAKIDQFTNDQLDKTIGLVGDAIEDVRKINPAAADAIVQDPKLQLGIADYRNQFGPGGHQLAEFLAGKPTVLTGGTIQAGATPTREDIQMFVGAGKYGQNPVNARGIAGREERFNEAMAQLGLGPAIHGRSHASATRGAVLKQGMHGDEVRNAQEELHNLGYLQAEPNGRFGPQTKAATVEFQRAEGLEPDGKIGAMTQARLDSVAQDQRATARDQQISDFTSGLPPMRDFSDPSHPQNALYNTLKEGFPPGVSAQVLSQCTAACYMAGMRQPDDLGNVTGMNGSILFESNSLFGNNAMVNMSQPTPSVQQTMRNVQQFDQQKTIESAQFQAQQTQLDAQMPQGR